MERDHRARNIHRRSELRRSSGWRRWVGEGEGGTCMVMRRSSTCTSLVRKSAPMVALYALLNFLFTYLWHRHVTSSTPVNTRCPRMCRGRSSEVKRDDQAGRGEAPYWFMSEVLPTLHRHTPPPSPHTHPHGQSSDLHLLHRVARPAKRSVRRLRCSSRPVVLHHARPVALACRRTRCSVLAGAFWGRQVVGTRTHCPLE
jgi:hypothetical protein